MERELGSTWQTGWYNDVIVGEIFCVFRSSERKYQVDILASSYDQYWTGKFSLRFIETLKSY